MSALEVLQSRPTLDHSDLVGLRIDRAKLGPDAVAFAYQNSGRADAKMTYRQIDQRARAVSVRLRELGAPGERVLVACPQGLDFIAAFFGCLYAGCVAVPVCPPTRRTVGRFEGIARDAGARLVVSTAPLGEWCGSVAAAELRSSQTIAEDRWIVLGEIPDELADKWVRPALLPQTLAMLQYTSGSTSEPKGVMLSHANLLSNAVAICAAFGIDAAGALGPARSAGVSWLPPYHDMGLLGGVIVPLLAGAPSTLMSPATFLRDPLAWLAAISTCRATVSGGPNFAYEQCVRRTTAGQRAALDLSCWTLAFVGAEPVNPETLERFAKAFAPSGFKASALYPCYGLAEATLMVSGSGHGRGAMIRAFDDAALTRGQVVPSGDSDGGTRRLVSSGTPVGDVRLLIAEPGTSVGVQPGRVGEIWVAGASVGGGYWNHPGATADSFGRHPDGTMEGTFLRTGDLGFVCEGELYVTGRRDDVLVIRGCNHHPQDLEATASASHAVLAGGSAAAFFLDDRAERCVTLVHEAACDGKADYGRVIAACRAAVIAKHQVVLARVVLVRAGTIPRTSSGKVRRGACRAALLARGLRILAEDQLPGVGTSPLLFGRAEGVSRDRAGGSEVTPETILAVACQHVVALGGAALSELAPELPLEAMGLDSLQRVELAARLEATFDCRLPDRELGSAQTLGELVRVIENCVHGRRLPSVRGGEIPAAFYQVDAFPEYLELRRYERMLKAVAGENPYFRLEGQGVRGGRADSGGGGRLIRFGDYDYLAMASDPLVIAATKAAVDRYGASAGASRLISGQKQVHLELERALAEFLGTPGALAFVSGHATNVTVIGHLMGPEDLIVHDALAHNSINQGAKLSGATRRAFPHNDWRALDTILTQVRRRHRRVLIAIEGVYSMDGDFPDLPRFVDVKQRHRAMMLVDEAHSLGTMGATGRGIAEHWGVARTDVELWMGTLSKALSSCGGYIAGSSAMVEYLSYTAPGFVYSVGLSPPNAAAALTALTLLRERPEKVARLRELAELFVGLAKSRGLNTGSASVAPVVPIILGNSVKTLRLSSALRQRGISVHPILQPAVSEDAARLRFFITLNHDESQIRETVDAVAVELGRL